MSPVPPRSSPVWDVGPPDRSAAGAPASLQAARLLRSPPVPGFRLRDELEAVAMAHLVLCPLIASVGVVAPDVRDGSGQARLAAAVAGGLVEALAARRGDVPGGIGLTLAAEVVGRSFALVRLTAGGFAESWRFAP